MPHRRSRPGAGKHPLACTPAMPPARLAPAAATRARLRVVLSEHGEEGLAQQVIVLFEQSLVDLQPGMERWGGSAAS
mgnify:CR=1 FL=1